MPERKLCKNVISRSVATRNLISKQKLKDFSLAPFGLSSGSKTDRVFLPEIFSGLCRARAGPAVEMTERGVSGQPLINFSVSSKISFSSSGFLNSVSSVFPFFPFNIRSAGGGQVLARLWRVGRSMFDVHFFQ